MVPTSPVAELSEPIDDVLESLARHDPASRSLEILAAALATELEPAWCAVGVGGQDRPRLFCSPGLPAEALNVLRTFDGSRLFTASPGTLHVIEPPDLPEDQPLVQVMVGAGMTSVWLLAVGKPTSGRVSAGIVLFGRGRGSPTLTDLALLRRYQNLTAVCVSRMLSDEHRHFESRHDRLTGLPNREAVLERIATAIDRRGPDHLALLLVDVNRFASVNDSLGRSNGDEVLRTVGTRIGSVVRPTDMVGRFDGDAFAVVCELLSRPYAAEALAWRISRAVAEPMQIAAHPVVVTVSVGIALGASLAEPAADHKDGAKRAAELSAEELLQRAASATSHTGDGGQVKVYREDLRAGAAAELELEANLSAAFEHGDLEVGYQPQVEAAGRGVVGAEALLRWDLDGRSVSPELFVPIAERSGLINPIGQWVFAEAAAALVRWDAAVPGNRVAVTVNVSPRQLDDAGFEAAIVRTLDEARLDPGRLWLEITETALVNDPDAAAARLARLRALGLGIAIDDFGTGYASLDYLRRFPMADMLKIDRTFVDRVAQPGSNDAAIVAASIALARSLGMVTVAEGVETAAQAAVLTELGCDRLQGNLFGAAMPAAALSELLGPAGDRRT